MSIFRSTCELNVQGTHATPCNSLATAIHAGSHRFCQPVSDGKCWQRQLIVTSYDLITLLVATRRSRPVLLINTI